jgi:predicted transcriptional regulator
MYKENPFTRIPNSIGKLSAEEISIMFHILANSDDWVINRDDILRKSKLGKTRFTKAWNHLKELGYINVTRLPGKNGQFNYHYTIYEIPEVQNQSKVIDKPSNDHRTTETHTTVTGGTNNYYITNTKEKTGTGIVSNALATKCRERHDQKEIGPNILDQEKTNEDILQIVPPPQLCFGSVRDNDEDHIQGPNITSPTQVPNNTIPIVPLNSRSDQPEDHHGPISSEVYYSGKDEISPQVQEILDNLEYIPNDGLREMIDIYYTKHFPNWENLLKKKHLQAFVKETLKLVVPDTLATELLTEYNIRLKKEAYKKH